MRKSVALGIVAATLAAGILYTTGSAKSVGPQTLRLFERDTQQTQVGKGDSAADRFIYSGDIFDHKGGNKLGRAAGECLTVSGGAAHAESICTADFILAGGQIITEGFADTAAIFGGKTVGVAIMGGTGAYQGARGSGTVVVPTDVPNYTDADFVLHLEK